MTRGFSTLVVAGMAMAAPLGAQGNTVDLTGAALAALEEPFSMVAGLAEVAPGVVVVSDPREQRLVLADLGTGAITDIGRRGNGPGEWQLPLRVFAHEGRAVVADMLQSKLHVVSRRGEIERSVPITSSMQAGGIAFLVPEGIDDAGYLYYTGVGGVRGGAAGETPIYRRKILSGSSGAETVARFSRASVTMNDGRGSQRGSAPYAPRDQWVALPNGSVAIVRAEPYRVEVHGVGRAPVLGPEVEYRPVRIGKAEREAYRDQGSATGRLVVSVGGNGSQGRSPERPARVPDDAFPEVMPPFDGGHAVVASPRNEVWVRRTAAASATAVTYDIFDGTSGRRIGSARLKPHSRVAAFGDGAAYVIRQDPADGLLYLERYALR